MPRPPGPHNKRDSQPLAVRVPNALYEAIFQACGAVDEVSFKARFPEWARNVFRAATGNPLGSSLSGVQLEAWQEGIRKGWTHFNQTLRGALKAVSAKLKVK
jgi:hypothetical protein